MRAVQVIRNYHGHLSGVYSLTLHPTLPLLITGGRDSSVRVWDIRTRLQVHCLQGHTSTIASLLTNSTDPQIISGSHDKQIRLWDLRKASTLKTLTYHKKSVRGLAMHGREVCCSIVCINRHLYGTFLVYTYQVFLLFYRKHLLALSRAWKCP